MEAGDALAQLTAAAEAAGDAAIRYFRDGAPTTARVSYKTGNSPVSEADIAANAVLERLLRDAHPECGWISEETLDDAARLSTASVFVVDPIDGTRAFIAGDPQWSVSVALVRDGRPLAGVVHAPALGLTYAAAQGGGARRNGTAVACSGVLSLRDALLAGPGFVLDAAEKALGHPLRRGPRVPSLAIRLARAADGAFDCAIASEGSHDWDVAAADIIVTEAGGRLLDAAGRELVYNAPDLRRGMLAAGPDGLVRAALAAIGLRST